MTARTRLRLAVGTTVAGTGLALVAGVAGAGPASASYICEQAGVYGSVTGTHDSPRECVTTTVLVTCTTPDVGLDPTIGVHGTVCVPG